jgi:hypothetical protein
VTQKEAAELKQLQEDVVAAEISVTKAAIALADAQRARDHAQRRFKEWLEAAQKVTPEGIRCLVCKRTSYNPEDVKNLYCGHCKRFHADMERDGVTTPK